MITRVAAYEKMMPARGNTNPVKSDLIGIIARSAELTDIIGNGNPFILIICAINGLKSPTRREGSTMGYDIHAGIPSLTCSSADFSSAFLQSSPQTCGAVNKETDNPQQERNERRKR